MKQRSGGMVILLASIVAGLLAALLSVNYLRGAARTVDVLVAAREIPAFAELKAEMFTTRQMPAMAVPQDALTDASTLEGRYSRTLILPDSVMRTGLLADAKQAGSWLAARLSETGAPGARAFAIAVDNTTAVGGTLVAGDKVDIIAAVRLERESGPVSLYSKVIVAGAPVLHRTEPTGADKGTIIVQVTPQQAEDIAFAQLAGTVYLATNPYRPDDAAEVTPGVTPDRFYQKHNGRM